MGIQIDVGDVFLVPLDSKSWALGQIVSAWNDELYVAIFSPTVESEKADFRGIITGKPIFLALTLDAKLYHGDWPIIENVQSNLVDFPQPAFKVRQSGVVYIESRDRKFSRPVSPTEAELLKYRTITSPAALEDAIKTHFREGERSSELEDLYADYAYQSAGLL